MRTVYISGPMRTLPKMNFPAFDAARDRFLKAGWKVISPADLDRARGLSEDSALSIVNTPEMIRRFVISDIQDGLLPLRAEEGDAIALLPGWERSVGAVAEVYVSRWLRLGALNAETLNVYTDADLNTVDWAKLAFDMQDYIQGKVPYR